MKYARTFTWCVALMCLIWASSFSATAHAEVRLGKSLKPADEVEKLTVTINVGKASDSDGASGDLQEGVALDLGLGFPLLLKPLGRQQSQAAAFGAVPQKSTAGQKISAGGSGSFTFALEADAGQDQFLTSSRLLAGIRLADISRIGFAGLGKTNWTLAGYEILVNDELLASNDSVDVKVADAQTAAQFAIAELGLKITPLKKTVADLEALKDTKLATEADLKQLVEAKKKLQPLDEKLKQLRAQIEGRYPWFLEDKFVPLGQKGSPIKSAKIALMTRTHSGADSKNRVYFRTGGHKYLLSSYDNPLSSSLGPQVFELDLLSGPLTAGGVRGFAVGMLANNKPQGDAPDRWHPERILVQLDGSIVYDSEEYPYDRKSLDAIRVIPPVHLDKDGKAKSNKDHTLREVYLWESGKAMGLDESDNSPLPLPQKDDPGYPDAEPGLPDDSEPDDGTAPDDEGYPDDDYFPGEDGLSPGGGGGGGIWPPGGGGGGGIWPPGGGGGGIWPPGGGGGIGGIDWWLWWLLGGGANPPPINDQVKDVRITSGWKMNDPFTVEWDFVGDESKVSQYRINLYAFRPDMDPPIQALLDTKTAGVGVRSTTVNIAGPNSGLDYVIAHVTADFVDATLHADLSPAHAVFPSNTDPLLDKLHISPWQYQIQPLGPPLPPPLPTGPIAVGSDPGGPRAVWTFGIEQSHIDHEFDNSPQAWNVALRLASGDASLDYQLAVLVSIPAGPPKKYRFVTYVGFAKGKGAVNTANFDVFYRVSKLGGGGFGLPMLPITVANPIAGVPQPMKKIEYIFDSSPVAFGQGVYLLRFEAKAHGGQLDADHPPAFFGARLVPEP